MTPSRRQITRLFLGAGTSLIFFVGIELVLRLALGPPRPALRVFGVLGPDQDYWLLQGDQLVPQWPGDLGDSAVSTIHCRDALPSFLVLGGSSVHGGTEDLAPTSEFTSILARRVGAQGHNLGFPGFDSHDLLRVLEGFGDCRTDVVVVYTGHNDLGNISLNSRYGTVSAGLALRTQSLLQRLQLYTQLSRALQPVQGEVRTVGDLSDHKDVSEAQRAQALRDMASNLSRIAWLTEQHDQALVVVGAVADLTEEPRATACSGEDCSTTLHSQAQRLAGKDPEEAGRLLRRAWDRDPHMLKASTEVHTVLREVAEAADHAVYLDAQAELPRHEGIDVPASELFSDGLHLSRRGHRQLAQLLAPVVGERMPRPQGQLGGGAPRDGRP